jgi:hypothetical protein
LEIEHDNAATRGNVRSLVAVMRECISVTRGMRVESGVRKGEFSVEASSYYIKLREIIERDYSWTSVVHKLMDYMHYVVQSVEIER